MAQPKDPALADTKQSNGIHLLTVYLTNPTRQIKVYCKQTSTLFFRTLGNAIPTQRDKSSPALLSQI